VRLELKYF